MSSFSRVGTERNRRGIILCWLLVAAALSTWTSRLGAQVRPFQGDGPARSGETTTDRSDDSEKPTVWLTGKSLDERLASRVVLSWNDVPLRAALQRLAKSQQTAIFLDRRVDPGQRIKFSSSNLPLEEAIRELAATVEADAAQIGSVIYVAPAAEADRIATSAALARDAVAALPRSEAALWTKSEAWRWAELSTPRALLDGLASPSRVRLNGAERVPHDLWPAADLPPLALCDRLSILLGGFGATFVLEEGGRVARLTALPARPRYQRSYRLGRSSSALAKFRREHPQAKVERQGEKVEVAASWRTHRELAKMLDPVRAKPVDPSRQRYSLRVENKTVGAVAKALALRLNRKLTISPSANAYLRRMVSFQVTDAKLDALLHAVFDPAGLKFEIDDEVLRLSPKD